MFDFDEDDPQQFGEGEQAEAADELVDELVGEEEGDDALENSTNIINKAMHRIEEANLFKTLIKQSIFAPNSARPEILDSVNRKIRAFAIKELEILLGMRSEEEKPAPVAVASQFSDTEVQVLKMLIGKVLKTDAGTAAAASAPTERKPAIVQIQAPTPEIRQVQTQTKTQAQPTRPTQQVKPAAGKKPRKSGASKGFATPNAKTKVKPMPTAEQTMAALGAPVPKAVMKVDQGITQQQVQSGQNLMKNVIGQLTGGQMVAVDNSNPADAAMAGGTEDVNSRF